MKNQKMDVAWMGKLSDNKIKNTLLLIIGTLLMAVAYKSIYDPAGMVTGGFSGIGIIIRQVSSQVIPDGIPIWVTTTALNIPLFIAAYKIIGKRFVRQTLIGTLFLTIFLAILPATKLNSTDYLLAAVFGGAVCGIGIGMVLLSGATTGGTDMLSAVIHVYIRHHSIIRIMQILDGAIIAAGMLVFGLHVSLYAIIAIYVTSLVSDSILEGPKHARAVWIISDKYTEISAEVMHQLERGATALDANGMFSNSQKKVLLCVVAKKQVPRIKQIATEIDQRAFLIVGDVREVMGEGFVQNTQ
jgi:uncharacterized membrane-anchored protein YitT (DUF2179 family)